MQYLKLGIHIKTKNFEKSFDFYTKLGFKPMFAYGDEAFLAKFDKAVPNAPEKYNGVTFDVGGCMYEIGQAHIAVKPEVFKEDIKSSKVSTFIDIESVDDFVKLCNEKDISIVVPPTIYPWGTREVVVRDPDGFILVFREILTNHA